MVFATTLDNSNWAEAYEVVGHKVESREVVVARFRFASPLDKVCIFSEFVIAIIKLASANGDL